MRVLVWSFRLLPVSGGQELFVRDLVNGLVDRGHDVRIIGPAQERQAELHSHDAEDTEYRPGVAIDRLAVRQAFEQRDLRALHLLRRRLDDIVGSFDPDIIHMHGTGPDAFLYLNATPRVHSIPMVFTCHGMVDEFRAGERSSTAKLLESAARVTAVSHSTLREILGWVPWAAPKVSVIHNGVTIPSEVGPSRPEAQRFLSASRLAPEKGLGVLISAFAILHERFPEATLVLAGEGSIKTQLTWFARRLGVGDRVEFPGWLDRSALGEQLRRATAVVVPSTWAEPFGLIAAEAGAAGRPVIASRIGGLPEIVDDTTGVLVRSGDIVELAVAMSRLIEEPTTAAKLGENAYERIREHFSLDRCIDEYERLLAETTRQHP